MGNETVWSTSLMSAAGGGFEPPIAEFVEPIHLPVVRSVQSAECGP